MKQNSAAIKELLARHQALILTEWQQTLTSGGARPTGTEAQETSALLDAFARVVESNGATDDFSAPAWAPVREALNQLSRSRAAQGSTAADTSRFVLSFKKPLFEGLQRALGDDVPTLLAATWEISLLVDAMAQHTVTVYQQTREDIIVRQQQELLELSTPVVKLWEGVLAVPMIGTLDSARTQLVMETLLQRIVETGSALAIIDITGVPTVDTLVAQHLLKTVTAIRLMGADCIISGIRPQIAQTIVHLGIDLEGITTKASLADALALAIKRAGYVVSKGGRAATGAATGTGALER